MVVCARGTRPDLLSLHLRTAGSGALFRGRLPYTLTPVSIPSDFRAISCRYPAEHRRMSILTISSSAVRNLTRHCLRLVVDAVPRFLLPFPVRLEEEAVGGNCFLQSVG